MALPIENTNVSNIDLQLTQLQTTLALTSPAAATAANSGAPAKAAGKSRPIMAKDTFQEHKTAFTRENLLNKVAKNIGNLTEKQAIALLLKLGLSLEQIQTYKQQINANTNPAVSGGNASQTRKLGNYFMIIGEFLQAGINSRESSQIGRLDQVKAQQAKLNIVNEGLKGAAVKAKDAEKAAKKGSHMPWWGWLLIAIAVVIIVVVVVATAGAALAALAPALEVGAEVAATGAEVAATAAETAGTAAEVAGTAAETAGSAAEAAGTTAEEAASTAEEASEAAEEAQTAADAGEGTQEAADEAAQTASDATDASEEANQAAEEANQAADEADQAAQEAQTAADEANQAADEAEQASQEAKEALEKGVSKARKIIDSIVSSPLKVGLFSGVATFMIGTMSGQNSSSSSNLKQQEALSAESTTTQYLNNVGTQANNDMQEEYSLIQNITSENQAAANQAAQAFTSMTGVDSINQNQS